MHNEVLLVLYKSGLPLEDRIRQGGGEEGIGYATDLVKKQKQELASKLKQTFGLSEDPVPWSESDKAYKAKFIVKAADNVLRQMVG